VGLLSLFFYFQDTVLLESVIFAFIFSLIVNSGKLFNPLFCAAIRCFAELNPSKPLLCYGCSDN